MNKNRIRRVVAAVMVSVMMLGMSVSASAATSVHKCAFSYMGNVYMGYTHVTYHTYLVFNKGTGKSEPRTCEVVVDRYAEAWKCACGATEYHALPGQTRHTARCGSN